MSALKVIIKSHYYQRCHEMCIKESRDNACMVFVFIHFTRSIRRTIARRDCGSSTISFVITAGYSYEEPRKKKKGKEEKRKPGSLVKGGPANGRRVSRDAEKVDAAFKSKDEFILRNELF